MYMETDIKGGSFLSSPSPSTRPLGVLRPIIHPPPDKTTGHRAYQSVSGHRPVSLPPITTAINIFTPLNGPTWTRWSFYLTPSWVSRCSFNPPFPPQKTALSSCSQSPWRRPSKGGLSYLRRPLLRRTANTLNTTLTC